MAIEAGDTLPGGKLVRKVGDGQFETVEIGALTKGRRIAMFCLPGAFTGVCSSAHLPSFVRTAEQFRAKGIDDVVCVSVNDAHVMHAWGEAHGAHDAGILMLGDPTAAFAKALGRVFDAPPAGLYSRMTRVAMLVNDGTVEVLQLEEDYSVCDLTGGETLLEKV